MVIVAIVSYILRGEGGFLRREDPFLTYNEEAHAVAYDPDRTHATIGIRYEVSGGARGIQK